MSDRMGEGERDREEMHRHQAYSRGGTSKERGRPEVLFAQITVHFHQDSPRDDQQQGQIYGVLDRNLLPIPSSLAVQGPADSDRKSKEIGALSPS